MRAQVVKMQPEMLQNLVMCILVQYFGWRADTIVNLKRSHVVVHEKCLEVSAGQAKVVPKTGLPTGLVSFPKLPVLWFAI